MFVGGYKISALEIEREILSHPSVAETAVIGMPDPTWGQSILALVVLKKVSDPFPEFIKRHVLLSSVFGF